jgi:hypothetical protein
MNSKTGHYTASGVSWTAYSAAFPGEQTLVRGRISIVHCEAHSGVSLIASPKSCLVWC